MLAQQGPHFAAQFLVALAGFVQVGVQSFRTAMLERQNDALSGALIEDVQRRIGEDDLPVSNLYLSMLRAVGVEAESFADSEGPLEGFTA